MMKGIHPLRRILIAAAFFGMWLAVVAWYYIPAARMYRAVQAAIARQSDEASLLNAQVMDIALREDAAARLHDTLAGWRARLENAPPRERVLHDLGEALRVEGIMLSRYAPGDAAAPDARGQAPHHIAFQAPFERLLAVLSRWAALPFHLRCERVTINAARAHGERLLDVALDFRVATAQGGGEVPHR